MFALPAQACVVDMVSVALVPPYVANVGVTGQAQIAANVIAPLAMHGLITPRELTKPTI